MYYTRKTVPRQGFFPQISFIEKVIDKLQKQVYNI